MRLPRRSRWHDLPRECPRARDDDQLSVGGADCEGIGVVLLEDAQNVGDLLAAIGAGPTPADHDPPTDVGGCEPDFEPVADGITPSWCAAVQLPLDPVIPLSVPMALAWLGES
jgi:hypothetical protein